MQSMLPLLVLCPTRSPLRVPSLPGSSSATLYHIGPQSILPMSSFFPARSCPVAPRLSRHGLPHQPHRLRSMCLTVTSGSVITTFLWKREGIRKRRTTPESGKRKIIQGLLPSISVLLGISVSYQDWILSSHRDKETLAPWPEIAL